MKSSNSNNNNSSGGTKSTTLSNASHSTSHHKKETVVTPRKNSIEVSYNDKNVHRFRIPHEVCSPRYERESPHGDGGMSSPRSLKKISNARSSPKPILSPSAQKLKILTQTPDPEEERRKRSWERLMNQLKRSIDDVYVECEAEFIQSTTASTDNSFGRLFCNGNQEMCQEVIDILHKGLNDILELKKRDEVIRSMDTNVAWSVRPTPIQTYDNLTISTEMISDNSIQQQQQSIESQSSDVAKQQTTKDQFELLYGEFNPYATNGESWADLSESPSHSQCSSPIIETSGNAWGLSPSKSSQKYQLHRRLSSPNRKCSPTDIRNKQEEKLAKAEWNRNSKQIQNQIRAQKGAEKIQQVTERKAEQLAIKKEISDEKLLRAQKNHSNILKKKSEDAKMENMKVDEVRFIQKMNTEDTKYQLNKKLAQSKAKREKILTERKEKIKEESVREAAAKKKREEMEQQRLSVLESQMKLKKEKEERILEEKKKKNAERQSKNLQYETKVLKTKETKINEIEQRKSGYEKKMEASAARKSLSLEMKREKAAAEYQKVIEANNRKSGEKEDYKLIEPCLPIFIDNSSDEKNRRAIKKKTKKIRHRLMGQKKKLDAQHAERPASPISKPKNTKLKKAVQDLQTAVENDISRINAAILVALKRLIDVHNYQDVKYLIQENIIHTMINIVDSCRNSNQNEQTMKMIDVCIETIAELCSLPEVCAQLVSSLDLIVLIEILADNMVNRKATAYQLCKIIIGSLRCDYVTKNKPIEDTIREELINYMIALGIVDKMKDILSAIIDSNASADTYLVQVIGLLSAMTTHFTRPGKIFPVYQKKEVAGSSTLVQILKDTTLVGILPLLTSLLLSQKLASKSQDNGNLVIEKETLDVTHYAFQILNCTAYLDLNYLQSTLGESFQSELFHIVSHLLSFYSSLTRSKEDSSIRKDDSITETSLLGQAKSVLNEVIVLLGFFTLNHEKNQEMVQFNNGRSSTLLQRLCSLPIQYFADPSLKSILLPTLISLCFGNGMNKEILEQEVSTQLITNYMNEQQQGSSSDISKQSTMYDFKYRFPPNKIKEAVTFLSSQNQV